MHCYTCWKLAMKTLQPLTTSLHATCHARLQAVSNPSAQIARRQYLACCIQTRTFVQNQRVRGMVTSSGASGTGAVQPLQVAQRYMDLSNQHKLEDVYKLFREDATYQSDALGASWSGLKAIKSMMGVSCLHQHCNRFGYIRSARTSQTHT